MKVDLEQIKNCCDVAESFQRNALSGVDKTISGYYLLMISDLLEGIEESFIKYGYTMRDIDLDEVPSLVKYYISKSIVEEVKWFADTLLCNLGYSGERAMVALYISFRNCVRKGHKHD